MKYNTIIPTGDAGRDSEVVYSQMTAQISARVMLSAGL